MSLTLLSFHPSTFNLALLFFYSSPPLHSLSPFKGSAQRRARGNRGGERESPRRLRFFASILRQTEIGDASHRSHDLFRRAPSLRRVRALGPEEGGGGVGGTRHLHFHPSLRHLRMGDRESGAGFRQVVRNRFSHCRSWPRAYFDRRSSADRR